MNLPVGKQTQDQTAEAARRREEKLEALRRDIQEGIDSGDAGPFDAERIKALARERRDARSKAH